MSWLRLPRRLLGRPLAVPLVGLALGAAVSLLVLALRETQLLWSLEFGAYDRFLRMRPAPVEPDPRIVLVRIREDEIQKYGHPLSDEILSRALETLMAGGARAVGVDLYRDVAVPPGEGAVCRTLLQHPGIVVIEKIGGSPAEHVRPPECVAGTPQVGFSDLAPDADGTHRRGLLAMQTESGSGFSLVARIAMRYLAGEGIFPRWKDGEFCFKEACLARAGPNDGSYLRDDAGGYQILLDYRQGATAFLTVTLDDLLTGAVPAERFANRAVIFGTDAPSVHDFHSTPFGTRLGIEVHAHILNQILDRALEGTRSMRFLPEWGERASVLLAGLIGAFLTSTLRRVRWFVLAFLAGGALLIVGAWDAFLAGWWLPFVPPTLAWVGGSGLGVAWVSIHARRERNEIRHMFGMFLHPDVAEDLLRQRDAFMEGGRPRPRAATITVLMSDLQGFTSALESLGPEKGTDWINQYMDRMASIVGRHGGIVDDYAGDGIKSNFGVPLPRESEAEIDADAVNAVDCALAIGVEMARLNEEWRARGLPTGRTRMGLYTGPAVVALLGSLDRLKYTSIGDVANSAARLETFQKDEFLEEPPKVCFRILVGEPTWVRLGGRFEAEFLGKHVLRGRSEPIGVYRVQGRAAPGAASRQDAADEDNDERDARQRAPSREEEA